MNEKSTFFSKQKELKDIFLPASLKGKSQFRQHLAICTKLLSPELLPYSAAFLLATASLKTGRDLFKETLRKREADFKGSFDQLICGQTRTLPFRTPFLSGLWRID